jgi:hypothetical protein
VTRTLSILALAVAACGGNHGNGNTGGDAGMTSDAGMASDADMASDAGMALDAGIDAGTVASHLVYTDPVGGALRLVTSSRATPTAMVLDFVVGSASITGYSTGFDLPLAPGKVTLGPFTPGSALSPGMAPSAAAAVISDQGPLRGMLVVGQSQKAGGTGAVATDTMLPPGAVLFTIELDFAASALTGTVFDGTAAGFQLPSGGLRNKLGTTIVDPSQVRIGKLEARAD